MIQILKTTLITPGINTQSINQNFLSGISNRATSKQLWEINKFQAINHVRSAKTSMFSVY